MFRAAFPGVSDEREKLEINYLKAAYEHAGANGGGKLRLAGMWVPPPAALHIATKYHLASIIAPLVAAVADNKGVYRKSQRTSTENADAPSPAAPPPPYSPNGPNKRRRGESPSEPASLPALSQATSLPVSRNTRSSASPARSPTRAAPAIRSSASPTRQPAPTPRQMRKSVAAPLVVQTPTIIEIDENLTEGGVTAIHAEEEIEQSKALVETLKAVTASTSTPVVSATLKRTLNDEPQLTLNLAKPTDVNELQLQRQIATNRRVAMTPTRKAAAWGALAFSIGLGAA